MLLMLMLMLLMMMLMVLYLCSDSRQQKFRRSFNKTAN
jgi:hypothetical protein